MDGITLCFSASLGACEAGRILGSAASAIQDHKLLSLVVVIFYAPEEWL